MANKKDENLKYNKEIGLRIRSLREALNLSRKELSERVDFLEYFLVELENGRKGPSIPSLCRLAEALHTTIDYLVMGRSSFTDPSTVMSMLSTIDESLLEGAEAMLKTYLNSISFITARVRKETKLES